MYKAVIAEDDFRVAQIHEQFLEKAGGFTLAGKSANGRETMELLEKEKPDLLLLDVYLPDGMGTELLPEIRRAFPGTDIIMITAAADKPLIHKALSYGAIHFLIKPITLEKFKEALQRFKDRRQKMASPEISQPFLDSLFTPAVSKPSKMPNELPSGVDSLTLERVKNQLIEADAGITAEEMGREMGASRTTARRYLEYLVSVQEARTKIEYGTVGRPERQYYSVQSV
ncbi:response regulator [Bacillus mangrovi]|uniref:Response regulator n=1 Tax=Metabacillus mangrovi TaxID=1491830 RepID=A0A7X2S8R3_9BACI|nr:response regulator [Metabacillus mangrovi]MTH55689.1 response regulator [Metabacillus mangrovi]